MMDLLEASKKGEKKVFKIFWKYFRAGFLSKKNRRRDFMIWLAIIVIGGMYFGIEKYFSNLINNQTEISQENLEEKKESISEIQARIDTQNWKPYQNTWYGFWLKYPNNWNEPVVEKTVRGVNWEQKINFRLKDNNNVNPFEGFDVLIYNVSKIKELSATDEFPKLKNAELISEEGCFTINDHLLEVSEYSAEEIYIPSDDNCYNTTLFFTNTRDKYIYNIIPKLKDGEGISGDPQQLIAEHIPEFFAVISTWQLIDIQRPKPLLNRSKPVAPMPISYKIENNRRVCEKKNDHPSKSKQNKGKHLDMECCLDPDEYPNPNCYYSSSKYEKYLK